MAAAKVSSYKGLDKMRPRRVDLAGSLSKLLSRQILAGWVVEPQHPGKHRVDPEVGYAL